MVGDGIVRPTTLMNGPVDYRVCCPQQLGLFVSGYPPPPQSSSTAPAVDREIWCTAAPGRTIVTDYSFGAGATFYEKRGLVAASLSRSGSRRAYRPD